MDTPQQMSVGKEITTADTASMVDLSKVSTSELAAELKRRKLKHGTASCYRNNGCRCDACRNAEREAGKFRVRNAKPEDAP